MPIFMYWFLSKYSITPNNWQETQKGFHFHAVHSLPWGTWPFVATSSGREQPQGDQIHSIMPLPPNPPLHLSVINILQCCGLQRVLKIIEVTCFWVDRELKDFFSKDKAKY